MTTEYEIQGLNQTLTVPGERTSYPDNTAGEETTFDFYIKGGNNPEATYQTFKEYEKYAQFSTVQDTVADVFYRVSSDLSRADIDSPVVKVTPGSDVEQARGVWGVITNISDNTLAFGAIARLSVTVTVLADADEYANHDAVFREFRSPLSEREAEVTTFETTFETAFESAFIG